MVKTVNTKKRPSLNMSRQRKRSYPTKYKYEECSNENGVDYWLCHITKKIDGEEIVVDCHTKYHVDFFFKLVVLNVVLFLI